MLKKTAAFNTVWLNTSKMREIAYSPHDEKIISI